MDATGIRKGGYLFRHLVPCHIVFEPSKPAIATLLRANGRLDNVSTFTPTIHRVNQVSNDRCARDAQSIRRVHTTRRQRNPHNTCQKWAAALSKTCAYGHSNQIKVPFRSSLLPLR